MQQTDLHLQHTETTKPEITGETVFVLGVSGGKDSAAALLWLSKESGIPAAQIRATFFDNDNEHEWTIEHVKLLSQRVHFVEVIKSKITFYALALERRRFPSHDARFCTEVLKIWEMQDYIAALKAEGFKVISVSGVRASESDKRSKMPEWDFDGNLFVHKWRPLINWTFDDVVAIHKKYKVPMNPLYSLGVERVGCFPCVMSRKQEIRTIALNFPDRIDRIRKLENEFEKTYGRFSSFFTFDTAPARFRSKEITTNEGRIVKVGTIDDVVRWSMTGKRAKGTYIDNPEDTKGCNSGYCE